MGGVQLVVYPRNVSQTVSPVVQLESSIRISWTRRHLYHILLCSVETVVLVLRSMPGVAHTMGSDIYKEIHFSLEYIAQNVDRAKDEIRGVLTHEMVHCYQYDGNGTSPSGFTEGIAGASEIASKVVRQSYLIICSCLQIGSVFVLVLRLLIG